MRCEAWQITFYHTPSGRYVTSNYGTKEQALGKKAMIENHGDKCTEPERVVVEIGQKQAVSAAIG
jgi:hypothetical protein